MRVKRDPKSIAELSSDIDSGILDLQPDFQRGEVWTLPKERLLIDSILRGWHVPPIHIVQESPAATVVLDGQQRLRAIKNFLDDVFEFDGQLDPIEPKFKDLHKLTFSELPSAFRSAILNFTIDVYIITRFRPEEPFELFYRLNQASGLTPPEKRNAFFGHPRDQVRDLVARAQDKGMSKDRIGFSNSRMAYDDVVARFLTTLEFGDLSRQVRATDITEKYRSNRRFHSEDLRVAREALDLVIKSTALDTRLIRFNKATLYSWLLFASRGILQELPSNFRDSFDSYLLDFETARTSIRRYLTVDKPLGNFSELPPIFRRPPGIRLMQLFHDRASSRVSDVFSVLVRDVALWAFFSKVAERAVKLPSTLRAPGNALLEKRRIDERVLARFLEESRWGPLP